MIEISKNFQDIRAQIESTCKIVGRSTKEVKLIAVSKTFPVECIQDAISCGQLCFGESKLQEAQEKVASLPKHLDWHFIGRVQRNKLRKILSIFPTVHAIDNLKLVHSLNQIAGELACLPEVFLQIDLADEENKGGFLEAEIRQSFLEICNFPNMKVVGLMTIPPVEADPENSRKWFRTLRELRDDLVVEHSIPMPYLSMGMSGDFTIAIEEGATHVRVGSSLFGKRAYRIEGELG